MPTKFSRKRRAPSTAASRWPRLASVRPILAVGAMPRELSGFVGRQAEVAALKSLLQDGASLITLTGIGGVGKTRLAIHAAQQVQATYAHGARLVTLAHLPEGADVASAVLAGLGLRERAQATPAETLAHALRDAHLLLVLDNCEQVVEASAELAEGLLQDCPGVQILGTSREVLGVPGERVFPIQPFAVPGESEPFASLAQSDAVGLFAERARSAEPGFQLTPPSAAAVGRICRMLDGIPLAIELAAARTKTMSVVEISHRLADPLALLTVAPRTAPARQQTLRATIDWSYTLLTSQERCLLRRLAGFSGGFTFEAAAAVCADQDLPASRILDLVDRLVAKSLVLVLTAHATTRYTLLETLRQYARALLTAAGEEDALRARHRDWYVDVGERVPPELFDADQMVVLLFEQHNLRAALDWSLESDQAEAAGRLAVGLGPLWLLQGPFAEGRSKLVAVADLPSAASIPGQTSRALAWAAILAYNEGAYVTTDELAIRALGLAVSADDQVATAIALCALGQAAVGRGDLHGAAGHFEAGLEHAAASLVLAEVHAVRLAEVMLELGNDGRADELLTQATTWSEATHYRLTRGRMLATRALLAERRGDRKVAGWSARSTRRLQFAWRPPRTSYAIPCARCHVRASGGGSPGSSNTPGADLVKQPSPAPGESRARARSTRSSRKRVSSCVKLVPRRLRRQHRRARIP
jgi:predicted ATPase